MRSAALLVAFSLGAIPMAASAQTTWHGLQFGQSRDEVRQALNGEGIPVEASNDGSLESTSDYQLLLPGMQNPFPLAARFHFTNAGGLMNVVLRLDVTAMRQNFSHVGSDDAMMLFAARQLTRALTDKYGQALEAASDCSAEDAKLSQREARCEINWSTPYESIELDWNTHLPHLSIRYQMLSPDL